MQHKDSLNSASNIAILLMGKVAAGKGVAPLIWPAKRYSYTTSYTPQKMKPLTLVTMQRHVLIEWSKAAKTYPADHKV